MSGLVQYIIVSGELIKTLKWPLGAVIAQCCHAATAVSHLYRADEATINYFSDLDNMHKVVLEVIMNLICIPRPFVCQSIEQSNTYVKCNSVEWLTQIHQLFIQVL